MHHSKAPDPRQELHPWINSDSLTPIKGLDTPWYGWRTRHPQVVNQLRTIRTYPLILGSMPQIYLVLGAWVGSQRKRPHCAFLVERGLAATRSAIVLSNYGPILMIFTFLIATRGRVSDLHRIRTISAVADTEAQARANLPGLPLVFVARIPCAKRGQA
ncbi:TPA: host cell division inhibitor Icd-like protein [Aeromonas salmonicida]|nr:host cell division inhibitor Icd-like protein [Aeromonas salmonicida]